MAAPLITRLSGVNDPGLLEAPWWAPRPPTRRPEIDAFIARLVSRRAEAEYLAERLIEALDAADGDADLEEDDPLEPSFGAAYLDERSDECEPDHDGELSLGWAANVSQIRLGEGTEDGDNTAPESHGRGFVRCVPDDHEDADPAGCDMQGSDNGIADDGGVHDQYGRFSFASFW